jgi:hypothetical protein
MLKKLLFITALCFTLFACNGNEKPQPNNTPAPIDVPDVTKPTEQEIKDALYMPEYMVYGGKKHLVLRPYVLMDVETDEVVDLRHLDIKYHEEEK